MLRNKIGEQFVQQCKINFMNRYIYRFKTWITAIKLMYIIYLFDTPWVFLRWLKRECRVLNTFGQSMQGRFRCKWRDSICFFRSDFCWDTLPHIVHSQCLFDIWRLISFIWSSRSKILTKLNIKIGKKTKTGSTRHLKQ